jgi:predicted CXXCH cytochrome family protein
MRIQLVTRSGKGPVKKTVAADWIRVGRNASCEIHLADPRVPLEAGMIVNREGLVYIEGEAGSQNITRKSVRSLRLKPNEPFDVGPYRLTPKAAPQGFDGAIEVEMARPLETGEDFAKRTRLLTLASLGFTKRWSAWVWALTVVVLFLALPAGRVLDLPWRDTAPKLGVGDRVWNPGPVMLAHQPIGQKCDACHQVAFEHVKDGACLDCHKAIGQHVEPKLQPAGLFQGERCTSCHSEHKGVKTTHRDDDHFCVACHRDLHAKSPGASAANVTDFANDHPDFRLTLATDAGPQRARLGEKPIRETPHLAFPHATHLDPQGVRSPDKGRVKMECASCHAPDASKRSFEPVTMAKHCQACHQLQFEPAVTTREVPHGQPAAALQVVEEFYANLALKGTRDSFQKAFGVPGEGLLRRAGEHGTAERQQALALASKKARLVGDELFEVRVCATCHEVAKQGDEWKITPVRANTAWMPHARFDHKAHAQSACADCHATASSKSAADVSMPGVQACRECHGGSRPITGKVTSNCLLCHGFHDAQHPWDPSRPATPKAKMAAGGPGAP